MLYTRSEQKKPSKTKLNVSIYAFWEGLILTDVKAQVRKGNGDAIRYRNLPNFWKALRHHWATLSQTQRQSCVIFSESIEAHTQKNNLLFGFVHKLNDNG